MSVDVFLTPRQRQLATDILSWVQDEIYPDPGNEEDPNGEGLRLLAKMSRAGWTRYVVPADQGGAEEQIQTRSMVILREALSRGSGLADAMFALQGLGSYPITLAGNREQKKRHLPHVASGDRVAAFALTEPEAGSDVGAIRTRAEKKGDGYVLDGTKCYISNAGIAGFYVVFASTDPGAGARGLTAFIVEEGNPGLVLEGGTPLGGSPSHWLDRPPQLCCQRCAEAR